MTPSTPINVRLNELRQELAALNAKRQQVYLEMAELKKAVKAPANVSVPRNTAATKPFAPAKPTPRSPGWIAYMRQRKAEKAERRATAQPTKESTPQEHAKARGAEAAAWKIRRADGQLLKRTCRTEQEAREQIAELQRLVKGGHCAVVAM